MRLAALHVSNYRALSDVDVPLSSFACLIGENNAGKSSLLQTLVLLLRGRAVSHSDFYDSSLPIAITLELREVTESDVARLAEAHRERVRSIVKNGRLVLVRTYGADGKGAMLYQALVPGDERYKPDQIDALVKEQRPGRAFVERVLGVFPELADGIDNSTSQQGVRQQIQELADTVPDEHKVAVNLPLPTGIDKSIVGMLPEPVYIPAVKDLSDDIKTSESASFGKMLAILLQVVEPQIPDFTDLFRDLNQKLNVVARDDGAVSDERLDEIKLIESTLQSYVSESFGTVDVHLVFPPPELKAVFASASILVNDGVEGHVDSKGDGLRRAVVFSILRTYAELRAKLASGQAGEPVGPDAERVSPTSFLLLFEEPELFLHPRAQRLLFDALRTFSQQNHVLVTTHSPAFFGPGVTETFIKVRRERDDQKPKPHTKVWPVDLREIGAKDSFEIICFENNSGAFFSDTAVLVEGPSDHIVMPHVAKCLDMQWDVARVPVHFARIGGKGNFGRYRRFFERFGVRTCVIADLDVLIEGFQHLEATEEEKVAREKLLARVDELRPHDEEGGEFSGDEVKSAHRSRDLRNLWNDFARRQAEYRDGRCCEEDLAAAANAFFDWCAKSERLEILAHSDDAAMRELKWELLARLRQRDVFVLEKGAIEDYYPVTVGCGEKTTRARIFCRDVTSRDAILECCGVQEWQEEGERRRGNEFELIFDGVFRPSVEAPGGAVAGAEGLRSTVAGAAVG